MVASAAADAAIIAAGLEKWFGPLPAVDGLDFTIHSGSFVTLFGPNGAGKSTLLRLLAGSMRPTRGRVEVAGHPPGSVDARRALGVLSHQSYLYSGLTVRENLDFFAGLYGLPDRAERVRLALDEVGLGDRRSHRAGDLSRGMQQRLALARTLLHSPSVVLLDEPYTGLDPHAARVLRQVLERLKDGKRTVLMVTHNLPQGLELAERVAVQIAGRWVADLPRGDFDPASFEDLYARHAGAG